MNRIIKKVAVLGSGVMGSRIACHFANIGLNVLLLDIAPSQLSPDETAKGLTLSHPKVKNRIVENALQTAIAANPAPLYDKRFAKRIKTGNFTDNMSQIADCDWIIEVVVERLDIKKIIFDDIEKYRKKGTIVSSNTSGIPINLMNEGRTDDFKAHFCGTHFFNPPRYLRLLEIIPTNDTKPEIVAFLMDYGRKHLGKTTVLCKDTPAFIANRVGVFSIMQLFDTVAQMDLTVEDIDKLTGPLVGRPKSATFRTSDVVGLDTLEKVALGVAHACPNDERKNVFQIPPFLKFLLENKFLGDKTGQGFYKKTTDDKGKKIFLQLDLKTLEYVPTGSKTNFPILAQTKGIDDLKTRLKILINAQDKAGEFYRKTLLPLFDYSSRRIPEISDEIFRIDDALKAGFGWELGPFEYWEAIGIEKGIELMKNQGIEACQWVKEMIEQGNKTFYKTQNGKRLCYDIPAKTYKNIDGTDGFIVLDHFKQANKSVWNSAGCDIIDIGDGILNVEFHTKMNAVSGDILTGIHKAIELAEKDFRGVVIGNDNPQAFSAGANIAMILMWGIEQEFEEIDMAVRHFQNTSMRIRHSSVPVVVAPKGLTLGGGCEFSLHADHVQAGAELYMGLVEVGVGLIPGGGGTKEMAMRVGQMIKNGEVELTRLQEVFMNIAQAKVGTSAYEVQAMGYLKSSDGITLNQDFLLSDAKNACLALANAGYMQPVPSKFMVYGKGAMAQFQAGVSGMLMGKYISEHDAKIANKLAYVVCGGDLSSPQEVSEQYVLDLEREAFLSLCGERKTLERIKTMLETGKPLRN